MEYLPFVIWICLWPLTCTIQNYLIDTMRHRRKLPSIEDELTSVDVAEVVMWIVVGIFIYP